MRRLVSTVLGAHTFAPHYDVLFAGVLESHQVRVSSTFRLDFDGFVGVLLELDTMLGGMDELPMSSSSVL